MWLRLFKLGLEAEANRSNSPWMGRFRWQILGQDSANQGRVPASNSIGIRYNSLDIRCNVLLSSRVTGLSETVRRDGCPKIAGLSKVHDDFDFDNGFPTTSILRFQNLKIARSGHAGFTRRN